ncbi:MAG: PKD domain-containing protein [Bacteroidota bacterium]
MKKFNYLFLRLTLLFSAVSMTDAFAQSNGCNVQFNFQMQSGSMNVFFSAIQSNTTTSYSWNFGDGSLPVSGPNAQHLFLQPGIYNVCLTTTSITPAGTACTGVWCDSVAVGSAVIPCNAQFTWSAVSNTSNGIQFTPGMVQSNATYSWNFGDGTSSNAISPFHSFPIAGPYNVCLTVTVPTAIGSVACTTTWCDSVFVSSTQTNCNAQFSATMVSSMGNTFYFNPQNNIAGTRYQWNFGDGTTDTLRTPTHQYASPGSYWACLTVTRYTSAGMVACTATWCDSVRVNTPVVNCSAQFAFQFNPTNNTYNFNPAANPSNAVYSWNFGDGGVSNLRTPSHVYQNPGAYLVCLTVNVPGLNGGVACTSSWCDSIFVNNAGSVCSAAFTWLTNNSNSSVSFSPATTGAGTTYSWSFGDGTSSSAMNPSHIYPGPGVYRACLTITRISTTGQTCTDTRCDSVRVNQLLPPVCNAAFQFARSPFGPRTFRFYALMQGTGTTYHWSFGDGGTSNLRTPTYMYADTGVYQVCLIVSRINNAGSCSDTVCRTVVVRPTVSPIGNVGCYANFFFQPVPNTPYAVSFVNQSVGNITSVSWNFGDSTTSNQTNPVHQYASPGIYTVCLEIQDSVNGCMSRTCRRLMFSPSMKLIELDGGDIENTEPPAVLSATIYPNPVVGTAQLRVTGLISSAALLVHDATGRLVFEQTNITNGSMELPTADFVAGMYYYRILTVGDASVTGRFIVR